MSANNIQVAGIVNDSITDGPGLRFTLFVQGCPHHCPGCQNPETWVFDGGEEMTAEEIMEKIKRNPLLSGVTFSGGEPFAQAEALIPLARLIQQSGLELAVYTGYTWEELNTRTIPGAMELLALTDVVVDGPFSLDKRNLSLQFRGSSNQRILNVKDSFASGKPVWDSSGRWGLPE